MSKKIKFIAIVLIAFLISMGVFEYFFLSLNQAQATNNYIEDIVFKRNSDDLAVVSFKVKTTFQITIGAKTESDDEVSYCLVGNSGAGYIDVNNVDKVMAFWPIENTDYTVSCNRTWTFTAGTTHTVLLGTATAMRIRTTTDKICILGNCPVAGNWDWQTKFSHTLDNTDYIESLGYTEWSDWWILNDTDDYYFTEYPGLSVSYPDWDDEIAGNFNIDGTITQPSPYIYNQLMTYAYLYNPLGLYDPIGVFTIPLLATSTQEFAQAMIGLPISNPDNILLVNELQKLEGEIITETYREGSGTEYPWLIKITTFRIGEAPEYPFEPPIWENYFDIYKPAISYDGYYKLKTPTSTIEFSYNFPETYKVRITQETVEKLATSTFDSIDTDGNLRFTVDDFDASTSTIKWVEANIYNASDSLIITMLFPIMGLEAGQQENIGIWGSIENFIKGLIMKFFFPSTATIDKFQTTIPNIMKSKIPYSYFYEIKAIIDSTNLSTSTTPFASADVDLAGEIVNIKLIDFSYLEEQGFMATIKDLMRIFLWGMFFMYLYAIGTAGPKQIQMKF